MLAIVREKLAAMEEFTEEGVENMLRSLAEEKQLGLGKVAQPLREHDKPADIRLGPNARQGRNPNKNR